MVAANTSSGSAWSINQLTLRDFAGNGLVAQDQGYAISSPPLDNTNPENALFETLGAVRLGRSNSSATKSAAGSFFLGWSFTKTTTVAQVELTQPLSSAAALDTEDDIAQEILLQGRNFADFTHAIPRTCADKDGKLPTSIAQQYCCDCRHFRAGSREGKTSGTV